MKKTFLALLLVSLALTGCIWGPGGGYHYHGDEHGDWHGERGR
jgi:hypothetical protein